MTNDSCKLQPVRRAPAIPMYMAIQYGGNHHEDDTVEHEVRFCVMGAPQTRTVAIVQSIAHRDPLVIEYVRRGAIHLPLRVLDQVANSCFGRLINATMGPLDGEAAEVWVSDVREWFGRRMPPDDAAAALDALAVHVSAGVGGIDWTCVWSDGLP